MGLEAALAWKTCTFGLTKKLPVSFTRNYRTILRSLEAFLLQMNRDNSGNSIDLILVGKCPLSVIRLWKRRNNTLSKGTSGRKKVNLKRKSVKNAKKPSHHRPQCAKRFSRYSNSKSGIWLRWTSPFCRFSASFLLKYDVTDAILQDIKNMKLHYLMSLLFDLFEILQAVRSEQTNFTRF